MNLAAKLKRLKHTLNEWNRVSIGNVLNNIARWVDRIIQLEGKVLQSGNTEDNRLLEEARKGFIKASDITAPP